MTTPSEKTVRCRETRAILYGLPPRATPPLNVVHHLTECLDCRAVFVELRDVEERLRQEFAGNAVPGELWDRITRRLDTVDVENRRPMARRRSRTLWAATAFAAAIALTWLGVELSDRWLHGEDSRQPAIVAEPVNDFITFRLSGRVPDVTSGDPRALSAWFSGKTNFSLPEVSADAAGFRLTGSRLCYFLGRRLSALMYEKDDRVVSLYVMDDGNIEHVGHGGETIPGITARGFRFKGHAALVWWRDGLVFVAVGNLPQKELTDFVTALQIPPSGANVTLRRDSGRRAYVPSWPDATKPMNPADQAALSRVYSNQREG